MPDNTFSLKDKKKSDTGTLKSIYKKEINKQMGGVIFNVQSLAGYIGSFFSGSLIFK